MQIFRLQVSRTRVSGCKLTCPRITRESTCNAGDLRLIPGSGRSPREGNAHPLPHSCLENPMDRGAWPATVHGVTKSQTQLSDWPHTPISTMPHILRLTGANNPGVWALTATWGVSTVCALIRRQTLHFPKQVRVLSHLGFYCKVFCRWNRSNFQRAVQAV